MQAPKIDYKIIQKTLSNESPISLEAIASLFDQVEMFKTKVKETDSCPLRDPICSANLRKQLYAGLESRGASKPMKPLCYQNIHP
jgi:hypothetical protein